MTKYIFGDSEQFLNPVIGANGAAPDDAYSLIKGVAAGTNLAIGGQMFADLAKQIFPHATVAGDSFLASAGTNEYGHGAGPANLSLLSLIIASESRWLAGNNIPARGGPGWAFTGSWLSSWNAFAPITMLSNAAGNSATVPFTGDAFDLGYIIQDGSPASFTWQVDGGTVSLPVPIAPPAPISTALGLTWAPALLHKSGFGAGPHTLKIVPAGNPYPVALEYIGNGSNDLSVTWLSAPKSLRAGDAIGTINSNTQAVVAALNAQGLSNVSYVDDCSALVYPTDLCSDGIHVNSRGNIKRAIARP